MKGARNGKNASLRGLLHMQQPPTARRRIVVVRRLPSHGAGTPPSRQMILVNGTPFRSAPSPAPPARGRRTWLFYGGLFLAMFIVSGMFSRVSSAPLSNSQTQKPPALATPPPPTPTLVVAKGPYSVLGSPTVSADFINRVLAKAGSPAQGKGQAMYDLGVQFGLDPVYALAFFQHESTFGTRGEAQTTNSIGNLRCIQGYDCIDKDRGGYARFNTWDDGMRAWYNLIRTLYVDQWGCQTIDEIIPKYAPSADNNNEAAYIESIKRSVTLWRSGNID